MKTGESTLMEQSQQDSRQAMDLLSHQVAIASTRTTENEDQESVLKTIMEQERVEAEQLRQSEAFAKQLDKDMRAEHANSCGNSVLQPPYSCSNSEGLTDDEEKAEDDPIMPACEQPMHECQICYFSSENTPMTYLCCDKQACWKCFTNTNVSMQRCPYCRHGI